MTSIMRRSAGTFFLAPLVISFILLSAAIVILGALFFRHSEKNLKSRIEHEHLAIAELKRSQIVQWREERLSAAFDIMDDRFAQGAVSRVYSTPSRDRLDDTIMQWMSLLCFHEHYSGAALSDREGNILASTPGGGFGRDSTILGTIHSAIAEDVPILGDLEKSGASGNPALHLIIPMGCRAGSLGRDICTSVLVLAIDPNRFLYPLIRKWPLPSHTSETLLLRREGNRIVFLNALRFRNNAVLSYSLPLSTSNLLGAMAARGDSGVAEGIDYRGVPCMGALLAIPGSPWFIVAKIDREEVYAPVRRLFYSILALTLLLVVFAGLGLGIIQRHDAAARYRSLLTAEREKTGLLDSLADSERQFRSLFESMTEGVALHEVIRDGSGSAVDYRIVEVNPAFKRQTGISCASAKGQTASTFYGVSPAPYLDCYARVAETGIPDGFETLFAPLDRYFFISVFSPARDRFATVFEDITERKRSEARIAEERERLLVTIRSIGDGVITTDVAGIITLMNKVAEELTGWGQAEAIGRPLTEVFNIINEFTRVRCINPVDKVLATGGIIGLANHTALIRRDGSECSIADSGSPIRDRESRIVGVVLVFRDITEKLKADLALQNAQRLESISILAGGIAHDFNNLLGGIFGYIDIARERAEVGNARQAADLLAKSLAVFDRAKSLTRQLLTFSKGGMPVRKTQRLAKLVRDAVHFVLSGSRITATISLPEDLWLCDFDENQLAQVIDNITLNACQAMPSGGRIEVSAANVAPENVPRLLPPLPHVRITIQDFGIGISPDHRTRIFDPFFTTKQQGSGLGLATSYSIIKKHDGCIEVESELGEGSAFHI